MLRLLVVVVILCGAFAACQFAGAVIEGRAVAEHAALEQDNPASSLATAPSFPTPETRN